MGGDPLPTLTKYVDPEHSCIHQRWSSSWHDDDPSCNQWIPDGGKIPSKQTSRAKELKVEQKVDEAACSRIRRYILD